MMHLEIVGLFHNSANQYQDFDNDLAVKLGVLKNLSFSGLEKVNFSSAPFNERPYAAYSAEFSNVSYKGCIALAGYKPFEKIFISIEINGNSINQGGLCHKEWFFQSGKNKIRYVGR